MMENLTTLSIIEEEPDDWRSSRPSIQLPQTSQPGLHTSLSGHRVSIFSSETSYGELLPPGQSALGLGIDNGLQLYEKSLPRVPQESPSRPSVSSRSAGGSVYSKVKSASSRHSIAKTDVSAVREPETIPEETEVQDIASPENDYSPRTIPSDQDSILSRSKASHKSARRPVSSKESSSHSLRESKAQKSRVSADTDTLSASSRAQSPIEFAPTTLSPTSKHRKSFNEGHASLITSSSITRSTEKPRAPSSVADTRTSASTGWSSTPSSLRTLENVRDEAATSLALRTKLQAETITIRESEHFKVGVCQTMTGSDSLFVAALADKIHDTMTPYSSYLFAIFPTAIGIGGTSVFAFCGAPQLLVTKASILAGLRFKTRVSELQVLEGTWIGSLDPRPGNEIWNALVSDDGVLWDIIRKAVSSARPTEAPAGSKGIEARLAEARAKLDRLSPRDAYREAVQDGILVDIRSKSQRLQYGSIPGAMSIERNELEWGFDPRSEERLPIADRYDLQVIVYCQV